MSGAGVYCCAGRFLRGFGTLRDFWVDLTQFYAHSLVFCHFTNFVLLLTQIHIIILLKLTQSIIQVLVSLTQLGGWFGRQGGEARVFAGRSDYFAGGGWRWVRITTNPLHISPQPLTELCAVYGVLPVSGPWRVRWGR